MSPEEAREIVASHLAACAVTDALDRQVVAWADFPEIGEHDWAAVDRRIRELLEPFRVDRERFTAAYEVLAARAYPEAS